MGHVEIRFLHGQKICQIAAVWKWFLHGSCGNQISTWVMWKSDFFSLVQPTISRIFWKCMEIFQWPSLIVTHTGIDILTIFWCTRYFIWKKLVKLKHEIEISCVNSYRNTISEWAVCFRYGNFTLKLAHGKKSLISCGPTALGRLAFLPVG